MTITTTFFIISIFVNIIFLADYIINKFDLKWLNKEIDHNTLLNIYDDRKKLDYRKFKKCLRIINRKIKTSISLPIEITLPRLNDNTIFKLTNKLNELGFECDFRTSYTSGGFWNRQWSNTDLKLKFRNDKLNEY